MTIEHHSRVRRIAAALTPLVLLIAVVGLVARQLSLLPPTSHGEAYVAPAVAGTAGRYELGVTTGPLARDAWKQWTPDALKTVNAFERAVNAHADTVMWYADWQHDNFSRAQLEAVAARGSVPEITWEPWNAERRTAHQAQYALREIIAGRFDRYIRLWARGIAAYGKPVRLRFAQEMNGWWYPWGQRVNGNRPGEYVLAWRHVHRIFTLARARNVTWVWSPVAGAPQRDFPGAGYVDALGVTCLNGGTEALSRHWRSLEQICGRSIDALHALAPQLPIELSEVGSTERGGSKAAWITGMFAWLRDHPDVTTINWFNLDKEANWMVQSSAAARHAFQRAVRTSHFR